MPGSVGGSARPRKPPAPPGRAGTGRGARPGEPGAPRWRRRTSPRRPGGGLRGRPVLRKPLALLLPWLAAACAPATPPAEAPIGAPTPGLATRLDAAGRDWIEETLAGLGTRERAAQLVMVWMTGGYAPPGTEEMERVASLVEDPGIGGVVVSLGLPHSYVARLDHLQSRARIPLLVASDFESGGPGMRLGGVYALPYLIDLGGGTDLPPTMAFGAIGEERFAYEAGRITGLEARAVGVQLNFAPVLDVNSDPANPVINTRSFGEDPEQVARLGAAFIRGQHEAGMLATGKHFPGHGDTDIDSHIAFPAIPADRARLDSLELVPFRRAIAAGVDAIMTAHVTVPGILGPDAPPASLSPYFSSLLLREELGFRGLLVVDALDMQAIAGRYGGGEAAVVALEAGADLLLMPPDPHAAVEAVAAAVAEGRLSPERLERSVRRVLEAKARGGLHRGRRVDLGAVDRVVGILAHRAFADSAATRSITVPRDVAGLIPLDTGRVRRVLSLAWGRRENPAAGRVFDRRLAGSVASLDAWRADPTTSPARYDSIAGAADSADVVVVSAHVPPRAGAGSVAVPEGLARFVDAVRAAGKPLVLISFGSPYLLDRLPDVGTYVLAWGWGGTTEAAAARALLGEAPVTGRLPVSLPPHHRRGEGLRRPLEEEPAVTAGAEAAAGEAGIDASVLERVDRMLRTAVADSVAPGAALAIGRGGRIVRLRGYGRLDFSPDAPAVTDSSVYDLASLTKPVATATALMLLVEDGEVGLDDPVSRHLREWGTGWKAGVTVRDLLLHRAGLPPFLPLWRELEGKEAYRRALARVERAYPPGDSVVYSDLGFQALGFVVEAAAGVPLDSLLGRRVFGPLGLRDTGFLPAAAPDVGRGDAAAAGVDPALLRRIAPTEVDTVFRMAHVRGTVHDENAWAMGGVAGHAGLFSSARDLAALARLLLDGGVAVVCRGVGVPRPPRPGPGCGAGRADSVRVLSPATIEAFTSRPEPDADRTPGWEAGGRPGSSGEAFSPAAFGHTGFTGTSLWIDPARDLFVVLLTNRVNPTREERGHLLLRRAVHDAVARATTAP